MTRYRLRAPGRLAYNPLLALLLVGVPLYALAFVVSAKWGA